MNARGMQRRLNLELAVSRLPVPAWCVSATFAATRLLHAPMAFPMALFAAVISAAWLVGHVRREGWTEAQAAVRLDRIAGAGGLFLTLREVPDAAWRSSLAGRLDAARPPPMQVGTPLLATLAALVFAGIVLALPAPVAAVSSMNSAAQTRLEQLTREEAALAEEQAVPAAVQEELARLRTELDDRTFDATDWEAADTTAETLEQAAAERGRALERAASAAEKLQQAVSKGTAGEEVAREREQLSEALAALEPEQPAASEEAKASGESKSGESKSGESKAGESKAGESKAGESKAGESKAGESKAGESKAGESKAGESKAGESKAGESKPGESKAGESKTGSPGKQAESSASSKDLSSLKDALARRQESLSRAFGKEGASTPSPSASGGKGQQSGSGSKSGAPPTESGTGGPGHGDAPDTPLRFGDETAFQQDRLRLAPLPPGARGDDPGEFWGLTKTTPTANTSARLGAPVGAGAGGDESPGIRDGAVPPRHRQLVKQYFDGAARARPGTP